MTQPIAARQRFLAYAMGGIGLGSNAFIYFLVPLRAYEMGASIAMIGLLLGAKSLVEAILSVPVGAFIDRVGPRRAVLIGSCGVTLVGVAFAVTSSVLLLFLIQVVLGLVRPLAWIGGQSYAAGMRGDAHRGYDTGRFSFGANVGQMVAPLIAGLAVEASGTRTAFAIMAAYGLGFVAIGWALPDVARSVDHGTSKDRSGFMPAVQLLRRRNIQVDLILTFTRLWVPSTWNSFLPIYLVSVGTSAAIAGSVSATMAIVATAVSLLAGRVSRIGNPTLMTAAVLAMSAIGMAATPLLTSVPSVYLTALLIGIGQGLSLPLLLVLVSTSAPPGQRSLALGLRSSVNQVAATVSPVLTAQVIALTSLGVGFALSGGLAAMFLVVAVILHPQERDDASH